MVQIICGVGAANVKIKIQNNPRPDDGFGGQDNLEASWEDKLETWAKMTKSSGREVFANRQTETRSMYKFEFRFSLSVTVLPTDRILVNGTRAFNIHSIENVNEQSRTMILIAEEGISD